MRNIVGLTGMAWAIAAAVSASSISTTARADDEFPLVVTEGLHLKHKGFEESVNKVGERFLENEKKMFYKVERECVESQLSKLKSLGGGMNVAQITIYLKNDKDSKSGKYAEVKTVKDCFLGNVLCKRDKRILEVGGIVKFENGVPAGCSVVDVAAVQKALHKPDVYVADDTASVSNRSGEKSRAPAGYFGDGNGSASGSGRSSGRAGSAQ